MLTPATRPPSARLTYGFWRRSSRYLGDVTSARRTVRPALTRPTANHDEQHLIQLQESGTAT